MRPLKRLHRFVFDEDGPTAVEYAVMLATIVLVCLAAILSLGSETGLLYQRAADRFAETFPEP